MIATCHMCGEDFNAEETSKTVRSLIEKGLSQGAVMKRVPKTCSFECKKKYQQVRLRERHAEMKGLEMETEEYNLYVFGQPEAPAGYDIYR